IDEEDERIIELWLQTKSSAATREAYARDVADFQNCAADKTLRDLQLDEILAYSRKMERDELAPRTRRRKIAAVKSLLKFAYKLDYLPIDGGQICLFGKRERPGTCCCLRNSGATSKRCAPARPAIPRSSSLAKASASAESRHGGS